MNKASFTLRADCPWCETNHSLIGTQIDPDTFEAECEECGFVGICLMCGVEIDNNMAGGSEDPRFCSDNCITIDARERAADNLIGDRE